MIIEQGSYVSRTGNPRGRPRITGGKAARDSESCSSASRRICQEETLKSVRGLWADTGISLSSVDIEENQRDMWNNFPRLDI